MNDNTSTVIRSVAGSAAPAAVDGARGASGSAAQFAGRLAFLGPWIEWAAARLAAVRTRVWKIVGPALTVVSTLGWIVVAVGCLALVTSSIWGWWEFTFLGATLIAAAVIATAFVVGRSTYAATIELEPRRVVVGERALGRLVIENIGRRNLLPSRIEMPVGEAVAEFGIPGLEPQETTDEMFAVPTVRRAVIVAGPVVAVRGDQLGLLRRTVRCADEIELFVHPRTVRLAPSAAGLLHDLEGYVTRKLSNSDMAFHALRPYIAGDDRRFVHWKASARTGQLMVRQFEETKRSHLTVVLSTDRACYASDEEFELSVSVAVSIAAQVVRSGNEISVVSERRQLGTRSVAQLMDDSCRLEQVKGAFLTAREFARETTKRLPPPTVLVFVTGSLMPIADLRSMHALFPRDVRSFAFRSVDGVPAAISTIPGLAIATVGSLDDLRGLVRRVSAA